MAGTTITDSGDFLDERLADAVALLVADTELRAGEDSRVFRLKRSDGECWVLALCKVADSAPKARG